MTENVSLYGGFWRRFLAFFLDNIIINSIAYLVIIMGSLFFGLEIHSALFPSEGEGLLEVTWTVILSYYGLLTVLNMVYFTYFHGTIGQTPGKMLLGLKVVRVSGEEMTLATAFLRWVGYIVSKLILYLGFVWIAFDRRKQGWHDKIAGTCVIRTGNEYAKTVKAHPGDYAYPLYSHMADTISRKGSRGSACHTCDPENMK